MGVVPHATDALARELHQTSQGKSKKHATGSHRGGGRSVVGKGTRDKKGIFAKGEQEDKSNNKTRRRRLIGRAGAERAARLSLARMTSDGPLDGVSKSLVSCCESCPLWGSVAAWAAHLSRSRQACACVCMHLPGGGARRQAERARPTG